MRLGLLGFAVLAASAACALPEVAVAQYMFFDTNGDGVSDFHDGVEPPLDTLYVWLDTNHYRSGNPATCPTGEELTVRGYELLLYAALDHGGSIAYGTWVNHISEFNFDLGTVQAGAVLRVGYSAQASAPGLPPGKYLLGEIALMSTGNECDHQMLLLPEYTIGPDVFRTSFTSLCPGANGDNQMQYGTDFADFSSGGVLCDGISQTTWGKIKQQYR